MSLLRARLQNEKIATETRRLLPLAIEKTKQGAYSSTDCYTIIGRPEQPEYWQLRGLVTVLY